jgi:hypothetical protein
VIILNVGGLGHGKSMRMVRRSIDTTLLRGGAEGRCWLASNILIRPPEGIRFVQLPMDRFSHDLARLMEAAREEKVGLVVAVDEIDEVWGAHDWANMTRGDRHRIKQSRKYGADLYGTAQYIDQVEKSIRNVTEEAELVRAYPAPSLRRREAGKRPWFIRTQRFRPAAVREIVGAPDKDKRLGSAWLRYHRADEELYDTDEIISPEYEEALCARHAREQRELRCPMCHPGVDHPTGLAELIDAARDSEVAAA